MTCSYATNMYIKCKDKGKYLFKNPLSVEVSDKGKVVPVL